MRERRGSFHGCMCITKTPMYMNAQLNICLCSLNIEKGYKDEYALLRGEKKEI